MGKARLELLKLCMDVRNETYDIINQLTADEAQSLYEAILTKINEQVGASPIATLTRLKRANNGITFELLFQTTLVGGVSF